jgi:hypothetical protein
MQEFTENRVHSNSKHNRKNDVEFPSSFIKPIQKNKKDYRQRNKGKEHEQDCIQNNSASGYQQYREVPPFRFIRLKIFFSAAQIRNRQNGA